jgi:hypothetical protein
VGAVCAILDVDDKAMPNRAELQLKVLDNDKSVIAVGGNAIIEYSKDILSFTTFSWNRTFSAILQKTFLNNKVYRYPISHKEIVALSLSSINPIPHSNLSFRKSAFENIGGYSECQPRGEDLDLILRLALYGVVVGINSVVGTILFSRPSSYGYRSIEGIRDSYFYCFKSILTCNMSQDERYKYDSAINEWIEKIGPQGRNALQAKWIFNQIFSSSSLELSLLTFLKLSVLFLKKIPAMFVCLKYNWMRDTSSDLKFLEKYVIVNLNLDL